MNIGIDKSKLELAFHGNSNWDLYAASSGHIYSIAKQGKRYKGCKDSGFGDKNHIKDLLNYYAFHDMPTERGLEIMSGLTQTLTAGHWHYFDKG